MKRVVGMLVTLCVASAAYALPDLQVTQANHFATGCLVRGQSYHGSGVIKNVGDVAATNFRVLIIMYGEETFFKKSPSELLSMYYEKSDDTLVQDSMFLKEVASLAPGESKTLEVDRVLPTDAPCQRYGIRVIVDVDNAVVEASEAADNAKNGLSYFPCDCPDAAPSSTPTSVVSETATSTPTTSLTSTQTPTGTATGTEPEPEATRTFTQTETSESTVTQTATLWPTPSPTMTESETCTRRPTCTCTSAPTVTNTKTPTATKTVTETKTPTATKTGTEESTATQTETSVPTATETSIPTHTPTTVPPTVTQTATATATGTQSGKPDLSVWFELLTGNLEAFPEGGCIADWTVYALRVHIVNTGTVAVEDVAVKVTSSVSDKDIQVFANLFGKDYEDVLGGAIAPNTEKVWIIYSDPFHPVCNGGYGAIVEVDPDNLIDEEDELDNRASKFLAKGCCPEDTPTVTATPTTTKTATATETTIPTATWTTIPPTNTPTATPTETESFCDRGFYILDSFGGLHRAGNPPVMSGGYLSSQGLAMDAERVRGDQDLAIIDGSGVATFVNNPVETPVQDFFFPVDGQFPLGRAVDLTVTPSGEGFWVLTDFGGIYRAGSAKVAGQGALVPHTDQLPIGYDIPFGQIRRAGMPNPGGTSLRAVAFAVINPNGDDVAEGYIILDSQGGRFLLDANGATVPQGTYTNRPNDDPLKLLDGGAYVWPFFPGLDIARDIELHPTQQGLVVLDGWGGIHPVPVDRVTNPVYFTRNDDPLHPGNLITTVGMPYVVNGFDDPSTPQDEGNEALYGIDAESIFVEFDFSPHCPNGFYTLDRWGGVFTFGGARKTPDSTGAAWTSPYFFPQMYGKKLIVY